MGDSLSYLDNLLVKNFVVSRTQLLRPKQMFPSLATQGNITSNNVSATMFPSLARPLDTV